MLPACFQLADEVFPAVKAETARVLVARGHSQSDVAKRLGVSQAMVSKYLARAPREDPVVVTLRDELLESLDGVDGAASWCGPLEAYQDAAHREALEDLLAGEAMLRQRPPLELLPQVGLNLARAPPAATSATQILAYPGRLVAVGERLVRPAPPTAGGSGHLARCLLARQTKDPEVRAVANLRGDADTLRAAQRVMSIQALRPEDDPEAGAAGDAARMMHHPGAVGLESCLYVFGPTATEVAHTILSIHEALQ